MIKTCALVGMIAMIAALSAYAGPGNFKKGDSWVYAYMNIATDSIFFPNNGNRIGVTDTAVMEVSFSLDSSVTAGDTTVWFMTKRDSGLAITNNATIGALHSVATIDTSSLQKFIIVNDTLYQGFDYAGTVTFSRYGDVVFFSFDRKADSIPPNPQPYLGTRKTISLDVSLDSVWHRAFQEATFRPASGTSPNGWTSSCDTVVWIDSVGLYQRKTYIANYANTSGVEERTESRQFSTLIEHNGKKITIQSLQPSATLPGCRAGRAMMIGMNGVEGFFDVRGRTLGHREIPQAHHGVTIRQFSNGRCEMMVPKAFRKQPGE